MRWTIHIPRHRNAIKPEVRITNSLQNKERIEISRLYKVLSAWSVRERQVACIYQSLLADSGVWWYPLAPICRYYKRCYRTMQSQNIKRSGRVTEGRAQLELKTLKDRRTSHRLSLLIRLLSDETRHQTLTSAYDELVNTRSQATMITRAANRGEPTSIYASSQTYYNSFLPRSVRDLITLDNNQLLLPHWNYTD